MEPPDDVVATPPASVSFVNANAEFNANITVQTTCNVCGSPTMALATRRLSIDAPTNWDNESTMQLLGLKTVDTAVRFCSRCVHLFRSPLYDESLIYGPHGAQRRKETFERYFPGQTYGGDPATFGVDWLSKAGAVLSYVSLLATWASSLLGGPAPSDRPRRILDWGGGDGYVAETIALASVKVLKTQCEAFCFDYHQWAGDSRSPYFRYIAADQLAAAGPFDLIVFSHVLEHTAFPVKMLTDAARHLAQDGVMLVAVPYEQPVMVLKIASDISFHQSAFSVTSLTRALGMVGLNGTRVGIAKSSYRGVPTWTLLAAARRGDGSVRLSPFRYVREIATFAYVTSDQAWGKVRGRMSRLR